MTRPNRLRTEIDLDLLAYDIADTLSRNEYPLDVSQDDIPRRRRRPRLRLRRPSGVRRRSGARPA